ncbi:hypothetical protein [Rhodopseudomonas sp. AAP120]|uniref:hypothetical protein n=1 Tax=Rhodopseudomonas sp. AAP120 TaxID=1523430 RepID=UPI0012E17822|nr:hypothetical protein [Rhodopseudomonas sp. AAP120]
MAAARLAILSMQVVFGRGCDNRVVRKSKTRTVGIPSGSLGGRDGYQALNEPAAPVAPGVDIIIIAPNSFRRMSSIVSIVSSSDTCVVQPAMMGRYHRAARL